MESQREQVKKRPYHNPKLSVYGDIRRITETQTGTMGDGAMMGADMTG
jgi:hypothetical protein